MPDETLRHENGNVTENNNGKENSKEEIDYRMGIGKWKPEWLQKFNSMKCFVVVLSIASLLQGIIVSGLTIVSLPSIEKEFGISSKSAGVIVAGNDASALLFVGAVSFFGTKGHKPRWMGIGVLITGIGGFLYALPKLLVGSYEPIGTNVVVLDSCIPNKNTPQPTCNENSSLLNVAIFFIAHFIMGGGTTPLYTLGPAFLDENVNPRASPIYLGIHFAATMLGPGLGFVLGSTFLRVFTNIELPEDMKLTRKDRRWIGAWWLGFVSISGLFFISAAFLLLFPKEMKTGKEKRLKAIEKGDMPSSDTTIQYTLKGYIMASKKIFFNKVFMLAVAALTVKMVYTVGMVSFLVKIIVVKFGVPPHKSGMILGAIMVPTIIIGILGGSYITRKVKVALVTKTAAKICMIVSLISVPAWCMYLIPGCQNTNMAGQVVPYSNETSLGDLYSRCNSKCYCSKRAYIPVCGSDGITYHSPCFAGCSFTYFNKDTKKPEFGNCSCIPPMRKKSISQSTPSTLTTLDIDKNMTTIDPTKVKGLEEIVEFIEHKTNDTIELLSKFQQMQLLVKTLYNKATFGPCDRDCKNFHIFIIILIPLIILSFISSTPHKMIILRSVPDNQRAFALGTQFLIMRSLSFLPGPIIMGALVDSQCTTWLYDQCGNKKNCVDYNVDAISRNVVIFAALASAIGAILYSIIVCIAPSKKSEENNEDERIENFVLS